MNALGGLSMGALGAMAIAVRHPSLYGGVAAFSGCLDLGSPEMRRATAGTVQTRGGNPDNMWGDITDAEWAVHDPAEHISALKGKALYVSSATACPIRPSDWRGSRRPWVGSSKALCSVARSSSSGAPIAPVLR